MTKDTTPPDELTFDEKYNIPVTVVFDTFSADYFGCGSHQIELQGETSLEHVQELYDSLKKVKGIQL